MKKIYKSVLSNQITLFQIKKKYKMKFIMELINELSILRKKRTFFFSFCFSSSYCMKKLISFISDINVEELAKYFEPCIWFSKGEYNIDRDKFIDAIELIQRSPIIMSDNVLKTSMDDYLKYIFDDSDNDIFIVDGIVELSRNCECGLEEIFERIREMAKGKQVVFIMDDIQYNDYLEYIDECFIIDDLDGEVKCVKESN